MPSMISREPIVLVEARPLPQERVRDDAPSCDSEDDLRVRRLCSGDREKQPPVGGRFPCLSGAKASPSPGGEGWGEGGLST